MRVGCIFICFFLFFFAYPSFECAISQHLRCSFFFSLKIVSFLDTFRVQWNFYSHGNVRLVQDIYRQHKRQRATSTVAIQCTHIILMGSHSAKQTWIYLPKNAFYARQTECARSSYIKSMIYSLFMDFGWALCGRYFHDISTIFRFGNIFCSQYSHAYARPNFLKSDETALNTHTHKRTRMYTCTNTSQPKLACWVPNWITIEFSIFLVIVDFLVLLGTNRELLWFLDDVFEIHVYAS